MPDPMWRQIAEDLEKRIEAGELGHDGQSLPSELELREEFKASRNTIRDAVKWLVTRGVLITRPGQGTFVVQSVDPFVSHLSTTFTGESAAYISEVGANQRKARVSTPKIEIHEIERAADSLAASELRLAEGESYVSRHQERYIDDKPWSLQTTFYPMSLVEEGATQLIRPKDIQEGAVRHIEQALGIRQTGWRDRITVRRPDVHESVFFKLPDDGRIAVFELIRTSFDDHGNPLRVTITTYPTDRNEFVVISGEIPDREQPKAWHSHRAEIGSGADKPAQ
jgi:GntR family transcriptional regulator